MKKTHVLHCYRIFEYHNQPPVPARPAEVAGAFLNLEPLVGSLAGVVFFADPAGPRLLIGGVAILSGIVMSSVPGLRRPGRARLAAVG